MRLRELISEKWSDKYKRSINCSNPKGFSQKAHCAGRKKNESINETNDYLWHGSKRKNDILIPRQATDTGGAEGSNKNAVYATPDAKVAIAMGLTTPGSDTGMFPNDPQMVLFKGQVRKGETVYLHKVPKDLFIQHNNREWYSKPDVKEIKPIEIKEIPVDKYLDLIRQATPKDLELRNKYLKKNESINEAETKQLGRAFNHLEDLVFFYGSKGTMEALDHIKDFATEEGSQSIRMKWDGNPQIYWGRETKGGPLLLGGHNGWSRGARTDSPEAIRDFILNKSGNPKTPDEQAAREQFAGQFANLYDYFDRATPRDFVGFVYADGLFLQRPQLDKEGVYNFCPNPKSQTCYHVRKDSELGKRIAQADVMVVGHAFFPEWGMPDSAQKPISDFSQFNSNPKLIVLGPVYNKKPVEIDTKGVDAVEKYLAQHAGQIDSFLADTAGLSDLKNIIYTYVNQTAKAKQLDNISAKHFNNWLTTSKVSAGKQAKIQEKAKANPNALDAVFTLVRMIQDMKDNIIDQIEGEQGDIWDTNGEGRVRYAGQGKQFGNVKLVPRKRWTPQ